jgi:hypothetical protein
MTSFYFYKLTADNNGAPCTDPKLLSLAICKPLIRKTAKVGDLIFGFAANSLDRNNRLIYIAKISEKLRGDEYYTSTYTYRPDCIYKMVSANFVRRTNAQYHDEPGAIVRDLGVADNYDRAWVLLSNDFRYFGKNGTADYAKNYPRIKRAIELLGQGHRRNHGQDLWDELRKLKEETWRTNVSMKLGSASQKPSRSACLRGRSCGVVSP